MIETLLIATAIAGAQIEPKNPLLSQQIVIQEPAPIELTLEQKIEQNVNGCTDSQWIRADNAECLDKPVYRATTASKTSTDTKSSGNLYSFGYCTHLVKNLRPDIPNSWGNASAWYKNAQKDGYATGSEPRVGSIAWTKAYGHVSLVIAIGDGTVTVKEANYKGWNVISTRTAPTTEFLYIF